MGMLIHTIAAEAESISYPSTAKNCIFIDWRHSTLWVHTLNPAPKEKSLLLETSVLDYASWNQGTAPRPRSGSLLLSSYSHDFLFNVHSYGITDKINLLYPKEITTAISSSIYHQHQWSRLSSTNKAPGYKQMDNGVTGLSFIGRSITSSIPLCCSPSHNDNNSLFVSTTSRTPNF